MPVLTENIFQIPPFIWTPSIPPVCWHLGYLSDPPLPVIWNWRVIRNLFLTLLICLQCSDNDFRRGVASRDLSYVPEQISGFLFMLIFKLKKKFFLILSAMKNILWERLMWSFLVWPALSIWYEVLLTLSLPVPRWAGSNTELLLTSKISKTVVIKISVTAMFFKVYSINFLMICRLIDFALRSCSY